MITRPLELASRLRSEPRNFDSLFFVNAGLLVLFFSWFGSRFVISPGLNLVVPQVSGANIGRTATTHYMTVTRPGSYVVAAGPVSLAELKIWLADEAKKTPHPSLLVEADANTPMSEFATITRVASEAGFDLIRLWGTQVPATASGGH